MNKTSSLQPVIQEPSGLVLGVSNTTIQADLTNLREAIVSLSEKLEVHFVIIGESHSIRVLREGKVVLHEILACIELPAEGLQVFNKFEGSPEFTFSREGYSVEVSQVPELNRGLLLEVDESILVRFPPVHGQTPETLIGWKVEDDKLTWRTLHTYPNEHDIVSVLTVSDVHLQNLEKEEQQ